MEILQDIPIMVFTADHASEMIAEAIALLLPLNKAVILWHLINNTKRFGELKRLLPKATEKMLAQQLRDLERDGLIIRTVYPVVPPKVEYNLSELGKTIIPVLNSMCNWGEGYLSSLNENSSK